MAIVKCKECGQDVSDTASFCPHCGAPVVKDMYCSKCGTKLPDNVSFCPNCGAAVNGKYQKDRILTALLAIILGMFGAQYFYIGKTTAGILSIVISICSCSVWALVPLVQGIYILTLSDAEFNEKYVDNDRTFPLF